MKVLLYGINFSPEMTGIGKYTGELAQWLSSQGHQVRVVAAPPYYPEWVVAKPYSAKKWQREHWQGVDVWRCPLWVPTKPGGLKRILHLASFALSSFPVMLLQTRWRADVVFTLEPPLFCAPTALAVARMSGAKAWIHIQDYEVDAAFELGLIKGKWIKELAGYLERVLMQSFDVVSTISGRMLERARLKGVDEAKLQLFPNWVDVSLISNSTEEGRSLYREQLGIPSQSIVALYSGNMGEKQGLEILSEAAALCEAKLHAEHDLWFVFCGAGVGRDRLKLACSGLRRVKFLDLQPLERLPDLLGMADIHLLPQRADAADLVMPSKLTGMLASGRPVVATAHPATELAAVVRECGCVVPPENAMAFADAITTLATSAEMRERFGEVGLHYAYTHIDRDAILQRFVEKLAEVTAKG